MHTLRSYQYSEDNSITLTPTLLTSRKQFTDYTQLKIPLTIAVILTLKMSYHTTLYALTLTTTFSEP